MVDKRHLVLAMEHLILPHKRQSHHHPYLPHLLRHHRAPRPHLSSSRLLKLIKLLSKLLLQLDPSQLLIPSSLLQPLTSRHR